MVVPQSHFPHFPRGVLSIDFFILPISALIAPIMKLSVVQCTEGYGPLVACLETPGPRLSEGKVMSVGGLSATYEAGLVGHVFEMLAIANALRRPNGQYRLVDACAVGTKR